MVVRLYEIGAAHGAEGHDRKATTPVARRSIAANQDSVPAKAMYGQLDTAAVAKDRCDSDNGHDQQNRPDGRGHEMPAK
jgi:hypothetical protein